MPVVAEAASSESCVRERGGEGGRNMLNKAQAVYNCIGSFWDWVLAYASTQCCTTMGIGRGCFLPRPFASQLTPLGVPLHFYQEVSPCICKQVGEKPRYISHSLCPLKLKRKRDLADWSAARTAHDQSTGYKAAEHQLIRHVMK